MYIRSSVRVPMSFKIIDHHCLTVLTFKQKANASNTSLAISIYFILFYFMHLIYRDLFLRYSIYPIQAYRRVEDDNRV
jgi:hypothetical protein